MNTFKRLWQRILITCAIICSMTTQVSAGPFGNKKDKDQVCVLHNLFDVGFFAVFYSILGALEQYDSGVYKGLRVDLDRGIYLDPEMGPNWWEYFFEPISLNSQAAPEHVITKITLASFAKIGMQLSREKSADLIEKYVHLKPEIQEELDLFVKTEFADHYIIGVHHRGTDKVIEVPIVPYAKTLERLESVILKLPKNDKKKLKIYVATDDQFFLNYMQDKYPSLIIHGNFIRSDDDDSLHYSNFRYASNYQKGKEALLECLLLSKCNCIILPPQSSLSQVALKFNPEMKAYYSK